MAAASSRLGKFRLMESFRWGCISFKYHKRGGLQVDCCRRSHLRRKDDGSHVLCTYSGNFKSEEERLVLIRRMKHFIIEGLAPECKTYEAHRFLQCTIARMPETDLPTNDELDRRAPPMNRPETDDEDLPPVKPAKKRALPKAKAKAQPVAKRARGRGRGRGRGGSDTAARGSADPPLQLRMQVIVIVTLAPHPVRRLILRTRLRLPGPLLIRPVHPLNDSSARALVNAFVMMQDPGL